MDFAEVNSVRHRRFPLASVIIAVILAAVVGYLSFMDVDVPARAMAKVWQSITGLGQSLGNLGGGGSDTGTDNRGGGLVFAPSGQQAESTMPPAVIADPMPMLVNNDNPVPEGYAPEDLVLMRDYCDSSVVYIKGSEIEGNRTAVDALMIMLRAAIDQGVKDWQISAGYRSVKYQQTLWDEYVYKYRQDGLSSSQAQTATAKYVAKPGCSEHHTGLAFDVTVPGQSFPLTEQSKWLAANCWDYGFIIRYAEDKVDITGINAEPWHIRYVGQPHATAMRDNNWALEEYLANQ